MGRCCNLHPCEVQYFVCPLNCRTWHCSALSLGKRINAKDEFGPFAILGDDSSRDTWVGQLIYQDSRTLLALRRARGRFCCLHTSHG